MIAEPAPAKINLALHIRAKRPDGYHELETLFAFARDGDVVTAARASEDGLTVTGPYAAALGAVGKPGSSPVETEARSRTPIWAPTFAGEASNLVTRARDAFRAAFPCPPVAITLEKNLPVASGIGGGSADAAATLRALARLLGIDPHDPRLFAIAAGLGADVPACLLGETAFATGRGDDLQPLPPLGDAPLLLVNPGVPLSTAAMFAAWDGVDRGGVPAQGDALARAKAARNDFTAPAIAHAPAVAEALDLLGQAPGCELARLSGSGATCFGIFADAAARDSATARARRRGWWALPTRAR